MSSVADLTPEEEAEKAQNIIERAQEAVKKIQEAVEEQTKRIKDMASECLAKVSGFSVPSTSVIEDAIQTAMKAPTECLAAVQLMAQKLSSYIIEAIKDKVTKSKPEMPSQDDIINGIKKGLEAESSPE